MERPLRSRLKPTSDSWRVDFERAAACRLTIRLPEYPDGDGRCRLREPQVGARAIIKRCHGWRLHITKRRQRVFKVVGLTWIVERTFAWLSQKSSLEQRLRVEGSNFGNLHRPAGHPPHAQTARPEVKLLKHPLSSQLIRSSLQLCPSPFARDNGIDPETLINSLGREPSFSDCESTAKQFN
jgi:hypothetical protein